MSSERGLRDGDWWQEDVHYKDFAPASVKKWPDRDAATVAEAWIYSEDRRHNLGIIVLVDEFQVATGAVTLERAIEQGRTFRDRLVHEYRQQARSLTANRVLICSWDGQMIEEVVR